MPTLGPATDLDHYARRRPGAGKFGKLKQQSLGQVSGGLSGFPGEPVGGPPRPACC
jgi:hypothetical protein